MKVRARRVLIALAVGVPTGALALMGLWVALSAAWNAWETRDWVPVSARVLDVQQESRRGSVYSLYASYGYAYKGQDYKGTRLSIMDEDIAAASWKAELASRLEDARKREQPVTVYVNDARPADAVVDRAIRWPAMIALGFDMLLMGGISWVALAIAWFAIFRPEGSPQWRAHEEAKSKRKESREAKGPRSGLWALWVLAAVWNSISFLVAAVAMPDIVRDKNWFGYLVLLLPLMGLAILWAAIRATWELVFKKAGSGVAAAPGAAVKAKPRFASDGPAYEFSPREAMPSLTVAIPPDIATVHDLGGKITIDYVGPTRTLYGDLTVIASGSELRVRRTLAFGLFKRKDFVVPAADVSTVGATHTNTDTMATPPLRYYKLYLWTSDGRDITIGRGLPGEEVTNALLLRIAKVLKYPYDKIWIARAPSP